MHVLDQKSTLQLPVLLFLCYGVYDRTAGAHKAVITFIATARTEVLRALCYVAYGRTAGVSESELELIQTHMIQKPMLRVEVCARALRASQNVKKR